MDEIQKQLFLNKLLNDDSFIKVKVADFIN